MVNHTSALLGPAEIRQLADKLDIRPTKKLGQNFVHDPNTVRRIVAAAEVTAQDHVLEVGPGLGSLTLALIDTVQDVTAVEIDPRLAAELPATLAWRAPEHAHKLRLIVKDALQVTRQDFDDVGAPMPTALVANLPYNVSVPVLLHLLEEFPTITRVLVMVQSEVADRLAAAPGSKVYGVPSVKASFYGQVRRAGAVGKNVFWPAPKIESGLVRIDRFQPSPWPDGVKDSAFTLIDAAFAQRRKTLRAALAGVFGASSRAEEALVRAGIDPTLRGEKLGVDDFVRLAAQLRHEAVAHGKVNLHLGVGNARPDGYHELTTVFQSLALADQVNVSIGDGPVGVTSIAVRGFDAQKVPTDDANLVWKAAELAGVSQALNVHIDKGIPVAGGMAGGSADSAAMLRIMAVLNGLDDAQLEEIAAQLGSDVPFTLHGGTMLGTGRGEKLEPLPTSGEYHWVLAVSSEGLSTPTVFATLDELRETNPELPRAGAVDALASALLTGDPEQVAPHLANDLQAAAVALRPGLQDILDAGIQAGALNGIVSGSGPTCAFLCRDATHAEQVAARLRAEKVADAIYTTHGPVAGAHLITNES